MFLVLFSASVVIFAFVSCQGVYFLAKSDAPKSHRRRGFSRRATAAMFVTTVINLLLFSLSTGTQVAITITTFQEPLKLDIDSSLSEIPIPKPGLVSTILVAYWTTFLPVSVKLSLSDSVSIRAFWRYGSVISSSFGGLGPSSKIDSG